MFIAVVFFLCFKVHAGKLGQFTNFTIVGSTVSISSWFISLLFARG